VPVKVVLWVIVMLVSLLLGLSSRAKGAEGIATAERAEVC